MKQIEIKNRFTGKVLLSGKYESIKDCLISNRGADLQGAYLQGAYLQGAYLQGADLQGAYLQGAYLQGADLQGAYLQGADLRGADLQGADLQGAYLRGAKGIIKQLTTSLYLLLDQPGKIRAYKIVNEKNEGIYRGGLIYKKGKVLSVKDADTREQIDCGAGINLATLDWCIKAWQPGYKILLCEFTKKDIAAIPIGSDGKFRVRRCRVVSEKDVKKLGLK